MSCDESVPILSPPSSSFSSQHRAMVDPVARLLLLLPPHLRVALVVTGAVLIHLSLGTYHTFGNMLPYMASYMRNRTDGNIHLEELMWVPTFQGCFPFAMVIGGWLSQRLGPRLAAAIGCALASSGVFLSCYSIQYSLPSFLFTYGAMFGLGQGIAYVVAVATVINWAPEKIGFLSGIVAAGFGVSSSLFAPLQTHLVNPWNYSPAEDGYFHSSDLLSRVPGVFTTLAAIYSLMQAVGLIVMCDPPGMLSTQLGGCGNWRGRRGEAGRFDAVQYRPVASDEQQLIASRRRTTSKDSEETVDTDEECSSDEEGGLAGRAVGATADARRSLSPREVIRSRTFHALFAALFCCSFYANMFYNLYKTYAETFIKDDWFLAMAFSVGSVANAVARIGWGWLTDRTSFQVAISTATCIASVLLLTMPLTEGLGKWAFLVWLTGMFVCMAATHALFITATVCCFGTRHKATNYGVLILSTTLSGILLAVLSQYVLKMIGYNWAFLLTAAFPLTAFFITSVIRSTPQGRFIST